MNKRKHLAVKDVAARVQDGGVVDDFDGARLQNLAEVEGWVLCQASKGPAHPSQPVSSLSASSQL